MLQTVTHQYSPNSPFNPTPNSTRCIRRIQRPEVNTSNDVILVNKHAKKSVAWGILNLVGALLTHLGMYVRFISCTSFLTVNQLSTTPTVVVVELFVTGSNPKYTTLIRMRVEGILRSYGEQ